MAAAGGGQPPGHDSFLASQQNALAQGQGAPSSKTGFHQLFFGIGSPKHNIGPDVQKAYWEGLIPGFKTSPFFKPGGGLNSRAKPIDMKKIGYQKPPGDAQHVAGQGALFGVQNNSHGALDAVQNHSHGALAGVAHGGESKSNAGALAAAMGANTTQAAMAAVQHQAKHIAQLGIGGEQSMPFAPLDPMIGMKTAFMTMMYNRMSPLSMPNMSPVTGVFANGGGGMGSGAVQAHQAAMAAQVAAMAQSSRSIG